MNPNATDLLIAADYCEEGRLAEAAAKIRTLTNRRIQWEPGYDFTQDPDKRNRGCHGLNIRFLLWGRKGCVQFLLYTGWLPSWRDVGSGGRLIGGAHNPLPADVGYHAYEPQYEGQPLMDEACEYLGGRPCYYDGSGLAANRVFELLVTEGEDAVWAMLADFYNDRFGEKP